MKRTGAVILASMVAASCADHASKISAYTAPPTDAPLLFEALADGVQTYICQGVEWKEWARYGTNANLFDRQGRQIGTYTYSQTPIPSGANNRTIEPTCTANDGSAVVGEPIGGAARVAIDAIPWRIFRVKKHEGKGVFDAVDTVREIETKGGVAHLDRDSCRSTFPADEVRVRYSARYQFYGVGSPE